MRLAKLHFTDGWTSVPIQRDIEGLPGASDALRIERCRVGYPVMETVFEAGWDGCAEVSPLLGANCWKSCCSVV